MVLRKVKGLLIVGVQGLKTVTLSRLMYNHQVLVLQSSSKNFEYKTLDIFTWLTDENSVLNLFLTKTVTRRMGILHPYNHHVVATTLRNGIVA